MLGLAPAIFRILRAAQYWVLKSCTRATAAGPLLQAALAPGTFAAVTAGITSVQRPQVRAAAQSNLPTCSVMGDLLGGP